SIPPQPGSAMQQLWDISPQITPQSPVFPGDTPYQQRWNATLGPHCPVNVSSISLSPHVGAHADAPLHYSAVGLAVGQLPLEPFLGPCRVIPAMDGGPLIRVADIAPWLAGAPARILIRARERASV